MTWSICRSTASASGCSNTDRSSVITPLTADFGTSGAKLRA